jgi:hypothetical protein
LSDPIQTLRPSQVVRFAAEMPFNLLNTIQFVLAELDELHRLPKNVPFTVGYDRNRGVQGVYDPSRVRINISRYAEDPVATFLHEFGHYLDNRMLHPIAKEYASRYEQDLEPLMQCCLSTPTVQAFRHHLGARKSLLSRADFSWLAEACEPHEMFARAYYQWVCTKSDSLALRASLFRRQQTTIYIGRFSCKTQWETSEFDDIMKALDELLKRKGML